MKTKEVGKRAIRSDKKREVRPWMNMEIYELINRLSYITGRPMKDAAEMMIIHALKSTSVIEYMSKFFRYDFMWEDRILYRGQQERKPYKYSLGEDKIRMPSFRFRSEYYDKIHDLAYALDTTTAQSAAFLLETVIFQTEIVSRYLTFYIEEELLDAKRYQQLQEILRYLNHHADEKITLTELLVHIKDELFQAGRSFKTSFLDWIDKHSN